ncbi:MAG: hypothetical protein ACP5U1_16015 [Desulfomonilaceae bacterium]
MDTVRIFIIVTACVLSTLTGASAWEVNLGGDWFWTYEYFDQFGHTGFFGMYDQAGQIDSNYPKGPKFSSMNSFVGFRSIDGQQYGLVTGTDASLQWMRMELRPEIKVNQAVTFRALYQIGYGTFPYGLYENSAATGTYNPIASGTWTYWGLTAQIPWGHFSAGKRPLVWGMGALYDQKNASTEPLTVTTFFGPYRATLGVHPWQGQAWINSMAGRNVISTTLSAGPQSALDAAPSLPIAYRIFDNDRKRNLHPIILFLFSSGNFEAGIAYEYMAIHNGPGGASTNENTRKAKTYDAVYEDGSIYFKFNNGSFFLNSELAWFRNQQHVQRAAQDDGDYTDGWGSRFAPYYNESWKYMMECGVLTGAAKLSLFYSWIPGPDRRHGIWINNQSWENAVNGSNFANTQVFLPYSLLMGYQYGGGLNAIDRNGEGYMTDASSAAVRLDYALAANLNIYGTLFSATRVSKGWGWGCLVPASDGENGGGKVLLLGQQVSPVNGPILSAVQNDYLNGSPSIPDDSLGWEVSMGLDWKLLENLVARFRGAYWRPGRWFKYACVDKGVATSIVNIPNPETPVIAYVSPKSDSALVPPGRWAINPNREIDPIFGFQTMMQISF